MKRARPRRPLEHAAQGVNEVTGRERLAALDALLDRLGRDPGEGDITAARQHLAHDVLALLAGRHR